MGLILDIVKFLFSSDFRDSVKSVFKVAKTSENWQKDISISKGEFDKENELTVQALTSGISKILIEKGWDMEGVSSINFTLSELVRNGIEHSKSEDKVKCKIEICSNYCTSEVTDSGVGFDLSSELKKQNPLDENSRNCTALGVIYRMMTSLKQTEKKGKNVITATLLKGYKYCRAYEQEQITVFEFKSEVSLEGYFWAFFINTLKSLKIDDKVIIHFSDLHRIATSFLREVNRTCYTEVFDGSIEEDATKVVYTKKVGNIKSTQVVICGNPHLNYALRNYLSANYEYFNKLEDAIKFLKTGKKITTEEKVIENQNTAGKFNLCPNGHYYQGATCPYCQTNSNEKIILSPPTDWTYGINEK
jgi:anti-sigma regulatory factor (Ser/Thr protein kinase)